MQIWKEDVTPALFPDDMIQYIGNPKESRKKLLGLIHNFGKAAWHKIDVQKSTVFLLTSNEQPKHEIKKTIPLQKHQKEYLEIYLTKEVQDLYMKMVKRTRRLK